MPVADKRYAQLLGALAGGLAAKVIVKALQHNPLEQVGSSSPEESHSATLPEELKLATELGIVGGSIAAGTIVATHIAEWQHNRN